MQIPRTARWIMALFLAGTVSSLMRAGAADHIIIPVSNPTKPVIVNVNISHGSILVTGYAGKDVLMDVESSAENTRKINRRAPLAGSADLKRLSSPRTGLSIQEENNIVNIGSGSVSRSLRITLQVPVKTSLNLNTSSGGTISVNDIEGDVRISNMHSPNSAGRRYSSKKSGSCTIEVHQVRGEIEINNGRGSVTLDKISGTVVAYAQNGDVRASFLHVKQGKPMSFSSMNGMIDVWLPPDIKTNVTLQSAGGEIHSDFDVKIDSAALGSSSGAKNRGSYYSRRADRTLIGKINGGGSEIQIRSYNGNIYIRRFSETAKISKSR